MPGKVGVGLRPVQSISQRVIPSPEILEQEYASKYLEQIGVSISKDNVDALLKELPIEKALVMPVWARGEMAIFPGMGNARKSDIDFIINKIYKPNQNDGSTKSKQQTKSLKINSTSLSNDFDSKNDEDDGVSHTARSDHSVSTGTVSRANSASIMSAKKRPGDELDSKMQEQQAKEAVAASLAMKASMRPPLDAQPELIKTVTPSGRKISWATVNTLDMNKYDPTLPQGKCTITKAQKVILPSGEELSLEDVTLTQFQHLLYPPEFTNEDMDGSIFLFCSGIGQYAPRVKDDKTGGLVQKVKECVGSRSAHKLYGLLCHYAYWSILHPWVRDVLSIASTLDRFNPSAHDISNYTNGGEMRSTTSTTTYSTTTSNTVSIDEVRGPLNPSDLASETSLPNVDKEQLYLQIQEVLMHLLGKIGSSKTAIVTSQQSLICCAHYVVDDLLTIIYPWLNAHLSKRPKEKNNTGDNIEKKKKKKKKYVNYSDAAREISLKLRRLMHQAIADLLDPSRIYTNHMLVSSYVGADAKSLTKTGKGRFYTTSVAVRSVFGDACNDSTRRFMMNGEDTYVATPGIARKFDDKAAVARDEAKVSKENDHANRLRAAGGFAMSQSVPYASTHKYGSKFKGQRGASSITEKTPPIRLKRGISPFDAHHNMSSNSGTSYESSAIDFKDIFRGNTMNVATFHYDTGKQPRSSPYRSTSRSSSPVNDSDSTSQPSLPYLYNNGMTSPSHTSGIDGDVSLYGEDCSVAHSLLSLGDSVGTTRSVANNKNAKFKVSLKAKAILMEKVTKHRAGAYSDIEKVRKKILTQDL